VSEAVKVYSTLASPVALGSGMLVGVGVT
jgi:hypothetical protein